MRVAKQTLRARHYKGTGQPAAGGKKEDTGLKARLYKGIGQLPAGGKKMFQKPGAGSANSTGMRWPSAQVWGGRVTLPPARFWVAGFSTTKRVPRGRASRRTSMAPVALTATVMAETSFDRSAIWRVTGMRTMTRWLRRRSSRIEAARTGPSSTLAGLIGFVG